MRAEVYIDPGEWEQNKQVFDAFLSEKEVIEREFGATLEWERLDDSRASRIAIYRPGSITSAPAMLQEIHLWTVEQLLKFKKVFGPRLKRFAGNIKAPPSGV